MWSRKAKATRSVVVCGSHGRPRASALSSARRLVRSGASRIAIRPVTRLLSVRALGLAVVALLVAGESSASAATVSVQSGVLAVSAVGDERNDIVIKVTGSVARISDVGVPPVATAGCVRAGPDTVNCQITSRTVLTVDAGGRDDAVFNDSALPSVMFGRSGDDSLVGGEGRDQLDGGGGFDSMEGRGGDDSVSTRGTFIDRIACGAGDDLVYADLSDVVAEDCERVARPYDTGEGVMAGSPPAVVVPAFTPGACRSLLRGTAGDDLVTGTADGDVLQGLTGDDRLIGGPGDDCLFGEDGHDELLGEEGDDFLSGGPVDDLLAGGVGGDRLAGAAGADRLAGEDGADQLAGNSGRDKLHGGPDADLIHGGSGRDVLDGGSGDDVLAGGKRADRIRAGKGTNRLSGGRGGDVLLAHNGGRDRIRCGPGTDTAMADRVDRVGSDCERVRRR